MIRACPRDARINSGAAGCVHLLTASAAPPVCALQRSHSSFQSITLTLTLPTSHSWPLPAARTASWPASAAPALILCSPAMAFPLSMVASNRSASSDTDSASENSRSWSCSQVSPSSGCNSCAGFPWACPELALTVVERKLPRTVCSRLRSSGAVRSVTVTDSGPSLAATTPAETHPWNRVPLHLHRIAATHRPAAYGGKSTAAGFCGCRAMRPLALWCQTIHIGSVTVA